MVNQWSSWGLVKGIKMKARLELKFCTGMKNLLVIQKLIKNFCHISKKHLNGSQMQKQYLTKMQYPFPQKSLSQLKTVWGMGIGDLPKLIEIY